MSGHRVQPTTSGPQHLRHAGQQQQQQHQQQHQKQQHQQHYHHQKQRDPLPRQRSPRAAAAAARASFFDKADSILSSALSSATGPATQPTSTSSHTSSARIYSRQQPLPSRRSRPSPAFAPPLPPSSLPPSLPSPIDHPPSSFSPTLVSVSPLIRSVPSNDPSDSSLSTTLHSTSQVHSFGLNHSSSHSSSSPPPLLPPRSRRRLSTVDHQTRNNNNNSNNNNATRNNIDNPLESFPPPAPPKPAHYYRAHHYRRAPLSPPLLPQNDDNATNHHTRRPPPYTAKLASLARALSPPLPPLPLNTGSTAAERDYPSTPRRRSSSPATMVSVGRVCCVGLPFVLAVVSVVALLVATLAGVTDKNLYIFQVNTTGLSISPGDAASLLTGRAAAAPDVGFHDKSLLGTVASGSNITAADLGLGKLYDVSLWNYCETNQNGSRSCTKPAFDWAAKTLNNSEHAVYTLASSTGVTVTIPKDVTDALHTFGTVARWTQIVFLIAFGALALEILIGLFTSCSRGVACLTFLVAGLAVVAVVAAAGLATATALVVVGALDTAAKKYGVSAHVDGGFLAAVWIAAAAAVAASFFWMFTVCCCSPDSRHRRDRSGPGPAPRHLDHSDKAYGPTGQYQPLSDPAMSGGAGGGFYGGNSGNTAYAPQYGAPRTDLAYEPYSHTRV
ncbi:integral membrane protein [Niveomyces insectorum RCEF 264]|uniref:Integral membrane protein n=1 Tax=Niveomyces insectorum RCEF 264 TaxID=1081102 RepID=A0A167N0K0_9HYPO|nr:integral membrane protein [Niveomyces insectorum RCEF 264]